MFHKCYWVILSLKYLVLDVNISIHSDRSLILSQAATIFQWIKPSGPPKLKYLGRTLVQSVSTNFVADCRSILNFLCLLALIHE